MQTTASVLTDQFPELLKRLPAGLDLDRLALETKAIRRKRKIGDGASLLRLALARGPGGFSLRQTSGWVSLLGIADLSNPGVHYRLKQAVAFLAALVGRLLAAKVAGAICAGPDARCVSLTAPVLANPAAQARTGASTACLILAAAGSRILN
jgi:hypothetical protein